MATDQGAYRTRLRARLGDYLPRSGAMELLRQHRPFGSPPHSNTPPERFQGQDHRTTFVNLWQNPDGVLGAHRLAQAVTTTIPARLEDAGAALLEVDGEHVGEVVSIPESKLAGGKWSGVQFARADLIRSASKLLDDGVVWVPGEFLSAEAPLCPLDEVGSIGPDVRDIRDGFEPTDSVTAYPMVENHDTNLRTRMAVGPDKYLAPLAKPRPGRRLKPVTQLWPKAGRLLVAERLRLNTARIVAMCSESPVLSNVWWPVKTGSQDSDKALAVWLNSSVGLLTLLATRNTTQGNWVKLKKADLQPLPVLDLQAVSNSQHRELSKLFDDLAESEFERLPAMAHCPARKSLDDGLSEILGLPNLSKLRDLLATEPVVRNRQVVELAVSHESWKFSPLGRGPSRFGRLKHCKPVRLNIDGSESSQYPCHRTAVGYVEQA